MIFWICLKRAREHQDRVIVRATELRTFCRTALHKRARHQVSDPVRANAPTNARDRVKAPARRTVPTEPTIGKTSEPIDKTQFPTSGAIDKIRSPISEMTEPTIAKTITRIDKIQFPTSGAIDKIRSLISEMTEPTTAKIIAIISATIVLIASTTLMSNGRIVLSDVMKFAIR